MFMRKTAFALVIVAVAAMGWWALNLQAQDAPKEMPKAGAMCKISLDDLSATIKNLEDAKKALGEGAKEAGDKIDAALKTLNAAKATAATATSKPAAAAVIVVPAAGAGEAFTGAVESTKSRKMPRITVGGVRYNLQAADGADAAVKDTIAKISSGELIGECTVKGEKSTVDGQPGILVKSITKN
jgi:hypothetical protein